jgi:hypothetical protein
MPLPMQVFDSVWPINRRARCISWQCGMKATTMSKKLQRLYESRLDANLDRPVSAGISWGLKMDIFKGKATVVTGIASGIGKGIAKTGDVADMRAKEHTTIIRSARVGRQPVVASALLLAFVSLVIPARGQQTTIQSGGGVTAPEAGDVVETGKKLSNPLSDVWALFTEFDLNFSDGNVNSGHERAGGRTIFQPIVPIPSTARGNRSGSSLLDPPFRSFPASRFPAVRTGSTAAVGLGTSRYRC